MNVAARVREEIAAGAATSVLALAGGDPARVNASLVDDAYRAGDPYARALWEEVADLLGTAIANLVTLLNPARLILGGGVLLGCPALAALVRSRIDAAVSVSATKGLTIERAWLGDDAGVIGAAVLVRSAPRRQPACAAVGRGIDAAGDGELEPDLVASSSRPPRRRGAPARTGSGAGRSSPPPGPRPCPGSSTTRASEIAPVSSIVSTRTTSPSIPSRAAASG